MTSLSFSLAPPPSGQGPFLKFEYSLLITESGAWNGSSWNAGSDVFDYPDGFALFTGGTSVADNCAVVPQSNTYLAMESAGIVPPAASFSDGKAEAEANLTQLINGGVNDGIAFSTGELVSGSFSENSNWRVRFLTAPLTCVYDAASEIAAGTPVAVEIVIADLNDSSVPPAAIFAANSVRWSGSPTPTQEARLEVTKSGTGSGTVTSAPAGIECGQACAGNFTLDSTVTLTAAAASDSTFTGWSGSGCSGTGTCEVTMSEARSVEAVFTATPTDKPKLKVAIGGPKKVLAGRVFTVGVRTTNQGSTKPSPVGASSRSAKATSVKTCLKVPDNLFVVDAQKGARTEGKSVCWTRSSLGTSKWVSYKVDLRSAPSFGGSESFQATANAKDSQGATVSAKRSATVQVREPRPAPTPEPPTG